MAGKRKRLPSFGRRARRTVSTPPRPKPRSLAELQEAIEGRFRFDPDASRLAEHFKAIVD